jgi:hypothetical protein
MNTNFFLLLLISSVLCTIRYQKFRDEELELSLNPYGPTHQPISTIEVPEDTVELTAILTEPNTCEDLPNGTPVRARSRIEGPLNKPSILCKSLIAVALSIVTFGAIVVGINDATLFFSVGLVFGVLGLWCLFFGYAFE